MNAKSPIIRAATFGCAALLAVAAFSPANAEEGENGNPVVAVVNGEEIRFDEVMESARQLPPQYLQQLDAVFPTLVERVVDMTLIAQAAEREGLADDAEVERRLEEMRQDIMREVYLQRQVEAYATEERLREAYEAHVEANPPGEEIRASHILVEERAEAEDLIAQLDEGADFAALARAHSIGPTGEAGGDLGYFARGAMVDAFEDAAFALEEGQYTGEPVETQFGWHVIRKTGERVSEPESFEEMREELRANMQREAILAAIDDLRDGAEVETFPERRDEAEDPDLPGADDGGAATQPLPDGD